jgi:PAS domain S-box-containing protein
MVMLSTATRGSDEPVTNKVISPGASELAAAVPPNGDSGPELVPLLEAIEAAVPAGLAAVNSAGRQVYVSPAFCEMVGWEAQALLGATAPFVYWPAEEQAAIQAAFETTLAGHAPPQGFEFRFCRRNGERFQVQVNLKPITARDGTVSGWLAAVTDISRRQAAERRLTFEYTVPQILAESTSLTEAAPRLIQTICEGLGWAVGALWRVDPLTQHLVNECVWCLPELAQTDFVRITASTTFAHGVGLPGRVWASGRPSWVMDVTGDNNFPRAPYAVAAGLFTGIAFPIFTEQTVTGVLECFGHKILVTDPSLLEVLANIGRQVGAFIGQRAAQVALQTALAQHSAALATVGEAIIVIDAASTIVQVNEEVVRTWGYPGADLVGAPLTRLMPPAYRERHLAGLKRYLETSQAHVIGQRMELEGLRQDGTTFPLELRITETRVSDQLLFTAAVRDITERKQIEADLRQSHDQLQAILAGVSEGVTVQNAAGQLIYANTVAAAIMGYASVEALLHASSNDRRGRFEILDEAGAPFAWSDLPGQRALRGEPAVASLIRYRHQDSGDERWAQVRAQAIRAADGQVQLEVTVFNDITDLKRAELEQRLLAEVGRLLSAPLDHDARLIALARLVVPQMADWCAIHVLEPDQTIRLVTVAHADPPRTEAAVQSASSLALHSGRSVAQVLRSGQSLLLPEITDALLAANAASPEDLERLRAAGLCSAMIVPLLVRDRTLGTLTLIWAETNRRYGPHDLRLAEELARLAAVAAHNAQLYLEAQALNAELEARVNQRTGQFQRAQAEAQALSQRLLAAREEERTNIAREIHDELGQQLTGLKIDLRRLGKAIQQNEDADGMQAQLREMADMLDHTIQSVRRIATSLRPAILDDFGLLAALEWQVQELQARTGISGRFASHFESLELDRDVATAVFRACQEALTNVARHAQATVVEVTVEPAPEGFLLTIRDNGRGITESELLGGKSLGLLGMRERIQLVHGTLKFNGIPGAGTTVSLLVPDRPA